jgi:hypothetical protein
MSSLASLIHEILSGESAVATTAAITRFYRTPGSAGYHAATNLARQRLRECGFDDLEVSTYPIDGETALLDGPTPLAWEPYGAEVGLLTPTQEKLVSFDQAPTCLTVWSQPTPVGGMEAEVVDVGLGLSDTDWQGKDLEGKVAFISHSNRREAWKYAAAEALRRGASGVLTDYFLYPLAPYRTRWQVPDAVQFLRLPNSKGRYDAWGCSLPLPAGQRMRELLALGTVTVHADIRCRSFKGYGQNVIATIPGRALPEEAVLLVAHTTGTQPGANCAAGVALLIEIARVLKSLIGEGKLRPPRRSIKLFVIAEGLGTEAYFAEHLEELPRIKAAICLDSVGNHQAELKSTLIFSRHPDSSPSFINDYYEGLMDRVPKDSQWIGRQDKGMSQVVFTSEPYTPWSDNNRFASFGIPSPLIMSTPSVYFHTQFLTADKMDPQVFRRAGVPTALALYEIADAGPSEAMAIADEVLVRSQFRLRQVSNRAVHRILELTNGPADHGAIRRIARRAMRELDYCLGRDVGAMASALGLVPGRPSAEAEEQIRACTNTLRQEAGQASSRIQKALAKAGIPLDARSASPRPESDPGHHSTREKSALAAIPHKVKPGFTPGLAIFSYPELAAISAPMESQDPTYTFYALRVMNDELWNMIDGHRSVAEIAEAVCMEFGFDLEPALFLPLFEGLERQDLIGWKSRELETHG